MRAISSYAKVQRTIGALIRNRRFQLRARRLGDRRYLNIGCGPNTFADFINLDFLWRPGVDVCWNLEQGLPFATASMKGIFTEHCLEHFPLKAAADLLHECRRVLCPGGVARIAVPDAALYLDVDSKRRAGLAATFPFEEKAESFEGIYAPILSVNRVWYQDRNSPHGHCVMYDFELLEKLLIHCGFVSIKRCSYRSGADPTLLRDNEQRAPESLYAEASA